MKDNSDTLALKVQEAFRQLSAAAATLNKVSDELGKSVSELDASLKKLNLGIPCWVTIHQWSSEDGLRYTAEELGYDKINGKWGISLRNRSGNEMDGDTYLEDWPFNEATRRLRIQGVEKLPELFEELTKQVASTTGRIAEKTADAKKFAAAVSEVAVEPSSKQIMEQMLKQK